jgi:ceramide glucosyltransferase
MIVFFVSWASGITLDSGQAGEYFAERVFCGTRVFDRSMMANLWSYLFFGIAAIPFVYYAIVLYSSWRYFRSNPPSSSPHAGFMPPVSILKPIRGLDPDAYENFASFCRQDYPEFEIVFCLGDSGDPARFVIEKLACDFPQCSIRMLFGCSSAATNDKVAKLSRLVKEARFEHVVISDSDVRVEPDYLRAVVTPLANPGRGAVTCFYVTAGEKSFADNLQTVGMISDFYAGILVARQLDGVKFALGPTIATTRSCLKEFGGYEALESRPADDLLVGRFIAERGHEVALIPYTILTVADYASLRELLLKRLRWIVVMRHMRPWGHLGLIFTWGLIWALLAVGIHPTAMVAGIYLGGYFAARCAITWLIGIRGLKQRTLWKQMALIPLWDALAFSIWVVSFLRNTIRWRDGEYHIRDGMLVPVGATPAPAEQSVTEN